MRLTIIGELIDSSSMDRAGTPPKHNIIAKRSFAAYKETRTSDKEECEIVLSVEQAQRLVISLFNMLPLEDRPTITWPSTGGRKK